MLRVCLLTQELLSGLRPITNGGYDLAFFAPRFILINLACYKLGHNVVAPLCIESWKEVLSNETAIIFCYM